MVIYTDGTAREVPVPPLRFYLSIKDAADIFQRETAGFTDVIEKEAV